MTQDQVIGLLRQLLPVFGGLAVALGWITPDKVAGLTATILSAAGPIMILAGIVWSLFSNSKAAILTSAANIPEVTGITLNKMASESSALDSATPSNVVSK